MDFNDDMPKISANYTLGNDLSKFSVDELKVLLKRIEEEKRRIQENIDLKQSQKEAADLFFKS